MNKKVKKVKKTTLQSEITTLQSENPTLQSEITVRITVKKQQWQTTIKNVFAVEELQMMYLNIHLQLQNKVIR